MTVTFFKTEIVRADRKNTLLFLGVLIFLLLYGVGENLSGGGKKLIGLVCVFQERNLRKIFSHVQKKTSFCN